MKCPQFFSRTVAVVMTIALLWGLARVAAWPVHAQDAYAQLRLLWRVEKGTATRCRAYTADELATIPLHMRQAEHCESTRIPYHLTVTIDDALRLEKALQPTGARSDHIVAVFEELVMIPGRHHVAVRCAPQLETFAPDARVESETLEWSDEVEFAPGRAAVLQAAPRVADAAEQLQLLQ